jgi:hypothetical protein
MITVPEIAAACPRTPASAPRHARVPRPQ